LLGTFALVSLVGIEGLRYTSSVPTWGWLASGGSVLLGAGLLTERRANGPIETGREILQAVRTRFE
jgi:hypothetical protein